ncbi:hypothetical protein BDQ12DRAFT_491364 [Crucibulum laeve]|uniref:G-patch domain-containing protein n=1 Tax=Crucibulum laeve TaxID=68775 RepID=A0A5C3M8X9_9AGAR|nr:hypothetical protein BDQ12DRAFT_491364 [Crucibulum laeve]
MEDGELRETYTTAAVGSRFHNEAGEVYDPAYEWPGESSATEHEEPYDYYVDDSSRNTPNKITGNQPVFRLVVRHSSILSLKQKIAVVDAYPEVQFGRDLLPVGSVTPRIRLKEMEVSKLHATAYWDGARKEWGVVDMGSMHGTFLRSGPATSGEDLGLRLSPSRVASIPRRLHYMDRLTIGGTTFIIHIHDSQLPCKECSPLVGNEIPLFPTQKTSKSVAAKRTREVAGFDVDSSTSTVYTPKADRDPKRALTLLKRDLLTRLDAPARNTPSPTPSQNSASYVDRAARRRALIPASHPDAPGVSPSIPIRFEPSSPRTVQESTPRPVAVSQPPTPLSAANIGHRLLMKQGWAPGTALGNAEDASDDRTALFEPLEISSLQRRAGLGSKKAVNALPSPEIMSGANWKEREKHRRFDDLRHGDMDRGR